MPNRELRLSRATIAPGAHVPLRPGQTFAECGPRAHWVENRGSSPATFIVANVHPRD